MNQKKDFSQFCFISASAGSGKTTRVIGRMLQLLSRIPVSKILSSPNYSKIVCITHTNTAVDEILFRLKKIIKSFTLEKSFGVYVNYIGKAWKDEQDVQIFNELHSRLEEVVFIKTIHSYFYSASGMMNRVINEKNDEAIFRKVFLTLIRSLLHAHICNSLTESLRSALKVLSLEFNFDLSESCSELMYEFIKVWWHNKEYDSCTLWEGHIKMFTISSDIDRMLDELNSEELFNIVKREVIDNSKTCINHLIDEYNKENFENYILGNCCLVESCTSFIEKHLENYIISFEKDNFGLLKDMNELPKSDIEHREFIEWMRLSRKDKIVRFNDYMKCFFTDKKELRKKNKFSKCVLSNEIFDREKEKIARLSIIIDKLRYIRIFYSVMLFSIVSHIGYFFLKRTERVCNYNDIMKTAYLRLGDDANKYSLYSKIEHILIDEAQDLDLLQWESLRSIINEFAFDDTGKSIFIVGDMKQGIFNFHNTEASSFYEEFEKLSNHFRDCNKFFTFEEMNTNYRANRTIVNFVNHVFRDKFDKWSDSIAYEHSDGAIYFFRNSKSYKEMCFNSLDNSENGVEVIESDNDSSEEKLMQVLSKISELSDIKISELSDVLVLFRTAKTGYEKMVKMVTDKGLKVHHNSHGEYEKVLTQIRYLLEFMYNPHDDVGFICAVSSIIGIEEIQIDIDSKKENSFSLWEVLQRKRGNEKFMIFLQQCCSLGMWGEFRFFLILFYKFLSSIGDSSVFIVEKLLEGLELNIVQTSIAELCLQWDEFSEVLYKKLKESSRSEKDVGIVFSTIHSAKGMEASHVIIADYPFSTKSRKRIIINSNREIMLKLSILKKSFYESMDYQELFDDIESNKLLYVAMTRAKSYLYFL
ncbi:UvrD-helicase domain-containing protein [Candidatus Fokinia crypta]|uniref:DNA 3'-5' helicase n=1 Tax=Candidatus Fokinia crypta TaxID=1920990 RepID=A0ABZ0UR87_9RICK|nr:UvrD-helicase domain-containing protein [Candidatus Fokinia cryptica]WPX98182.1 RecB-like double-strand break repair helicase N-terminal domain protein [Candidatus Fokinia cryptica]